MPLPMRNASMRYASMRNAPMRNAPMPMPPMRNAPMRNAMVHDALCMMCRSRYWVCLVGLEEQTPDLVTLSGKTALPGQKISPVRTFSENFESIQRVFRKGLHWIEVLTQKRRKVKENAESDLWSLQAQGANWALHKYEGPEQRIRREDGLGVCEHCNSRFSYYLVHSGFNDSSYAYCDSCGCTAILDDYAPRPNGAPFVRFKRITSGVEPYLEPCGCGGRFTAAGEPRCPKCKTTLSAIVATSWIEHNAPGTSKGWRWQRTWDDLYCIVIEGQVISNPWRH